MHALKKNHEIACYKNSNAKTSVYIYGKVNSIPFAINSIYLSYGLMGGKWNGKDMRCCL